MLQHPLSSNKLREYMIRAMYIEMLGYDASFAYIHAIKMTNDRNALVKRIGYLACCVFLNNNHEFLVLLVNTLQRDMKSRNQLDVASALSSLPYLLNSEIFSSIEDTLIVLLSHQTPAIRRRAYLALLNALEIKPTIFEENPDILVNGLCDPDISVRNSVLYLVDKVSSFNPRQCIPLVPHILTTMKQILDNSVPKEYDYYFISAPWTQINILQTLSKIVSLENNINQIYEILYNSIKKIENIISMSSYHGKPIVYSTNSNSTSNTTNISYAILESCIRTIASIRPNNELLGIVEELISKFINSDISYLKYIGIKCLSKISVIDPSYAIPHQIVVVDCLEDKDETIRRCTLELLCNMSNPQNIKVIISKLITHLRSSTDSHFCEELVKNILLLSEKFAPSYNWYLNTMFSLFELSGEFVGVEKVNNIAQIIAEGPTGNEVADNEFRIYASYLCSKHLEEKIDLLPEILYNLGIWVVGEYGSCVENSCETNTPKVFYKVTALLYKVFQTLKANVFACQSNIKRIKDSFVNHNITMMNNTKPETISMIVFALLKCYSYTLTSYKRPIGSENLFEAVEIESNVDYISFLDKMNEIYNQTFTDSCSIPFNMIYQRVKEFISIIRLSDEMNTNSTKSTEMKYIEFLSYILPFDASCEEIYVDRKLSFLDEIVSEHKLSSEHKREERTNPYITAETHFNQELNNIEIFENETDLIEISSDVGIETEFELYHKTSMELNKHDKTNCLINSVVENIEKYPKIKEPIVEDINCTFQADQINNILRDGEYLTKMWCPEGFVKHEKLRNKESGQVTKKVNNLNNTHIYEEKNCINFSFKQKEANALFCGISNTPKKK
ncbi:hypothetical protein OJ253_1290 [Cryptosporidium canis]|uniref:Clathrin/coatomer adaptor adaptin-like N-terminal domain-containing protein n=1 Tax=Cryptosporidium canis TaxID=195482 RepID=A0A9D5DLL8_9CRYT|nr:hypothetical protein OJ253_1290 [Cryptosporidium canis]